MNTEISIYHKYLIYFFIGGTILVLLHYIAIHINPTAAAFLWSFPVLSLPAYFFIYKETHKRDLIMDMNTDIIIFFFINLLFFFILYYLLKKTEIHVYSCILYSLVIFIVIGVVVYTCLRNIKN